jgi:hypothetical protein
MLDGNDHTDDDTEFGLCPARWRLASLADLDMWKLGSLYSTLGHEKLIGQDGRSAELVRCLSQLLHLHSL